MRAGIDLRTLQRWNAHDGLVSDDGRPAPHALTPGERAQMLHGTNEPRFAEVSPARIVSMLADEGVYIASESSFARVLREHGQVTYRGRAKAPKATRPPRHTSPRRRAKCGAGILLAGDRLGQMVPPVPDPGPV
jgi:hypothetical protein